MGEVARPGLKLVTRGMPRVGPCPGGMGEVARPGLKLPRIVVGCRRLSWWNGRGGPSGFETLCFRRLQAVGFRGGMGEVARPGLKPCRVSCPAPEVAGVEWERWPVRV